MRTSGERDRGSKTDIYYDLFLPSFLFPRIISDAFVFSSSCFLFSIPFFLLFRRHRPTLLRPKGGRRGRATQHPRRRCISSFNNDERSDARNNPPRLGRIERRSRWAWAKCRRRSVLRCIATCHSRGCTWEEGGMTDFV